MIRSNAYSMSCEVTARLTGGPNMTFVRSVNVYVRPSADTCGIAVAMSGTGVSPPSVAFLWLYVMSPRSNSCP